MSKRYNFAAVLSAVVLICCGALILGQKVNAAGEGKITGTVKLDGTAPHMKGIDMAKDPYCSKAHASDPGHLETYVVGADGGMANVVVYISEGLTGSAASEASATEPVFDQKNCMYTPHVLALAVDQKFKVTTSDQTTHNIHPTPKDNREWNESQPPSSPAIEKNFAREEIMLPVKCNQHPWMKMYVSVVKTPFYAVTDKSGKYEIKGLPPGDYTIAFVHEKLGEQDQKVTVGPKDTKTVDASFKAGAGE